MKQTHIKNPFVNLLKDNPNHSLHDLKTTFHERPYLEYEWLYRLHQGTPTHPECPGLSTSWEAMPN